MSGPATATVQHLAAAEPLSGQSSLASTDCKWISSNVTESRSRASTGGGVLMYAKRGRICIDSMGHIVSTSMRF